MSETCEHKNFKVEARVSRVEDASKKIRLMLSLVTICTDCQKTFAMRNPVLPGNMVEITVEKET